MCTYLREQESHEATTGVLEQVGEGSPAPHPPTLCPLVPLLVAVISHARVCGLHFAGGVFTFSICSEIILDYCILQA